MKTNPAQNRPCLLWQPLQFFIYTNGTLLPRMRSANLKKNVTEILRTTFTKDVVVRTSATLKWNWGPCKGRSLWNIYFPLGSTQQAIQMHKATEQLQYRLKQGCHRISLVQERNLDKKINTNSTNSGGDKLLFSKRNGERYKTHAQESCAGLYWLHLVPVFRLKLMVDVQHVLYSVLLQPQRRTFLKFQVQ